MTNEELAVKLEAVDQRSKSNTHRIDDLEKDHAALNRLATAVEVMATKQDTMSDSVDRLTGKVEALESKPVRRWDGLVDKLLFAVAGAVIAWIAAGTPGL